MKGWTRKVWENGWIPEFVHDTIFNFPLDKSKVSMSIISINLSEEANKNVVFLRTTNSLLSLHALPIPQMGILPKGSVDTWALPEKIVKKGSS
jgi:hypothetical protein